MRWLIDNRGNRNLMVGARVTITDKNIEKQREMVDYFYDLGIRYVWTNPLFYGVGKIPVCQDEEKNTTITLIWQNTLKIILMRIVNNAGAFSGDENIDNYDMKVWDSVFAVNLNAPLMLSVGLKPNMPKDFVIVNMVSTDGLKGSFSSMAYAASKAALINLTDSLAINFGYDKKKSVLLQSAQVGLRRLMKKIQAPPKWCLLFLEVQVLSFVH